MRYVLKTHYSQDQALLRRPGQRFWYALLGLLALTLPLWATNYWLPLITLIVIYCVAGLGLMLLVGFTGLFSIGHAAFLGVGAYTEAYLTNLGLPFPLCMAAAALISAACGVFVGLPALRVKGVYLAIATLALGFIAQEVFSRWQSVTGGNDGLRVKAPIVFGSLTLHSTASLYYLALGMCTLVTLAVLNLLRGSTGRAFIAIRDSEVSAQSMGIHLARYKTLAFALSAAIVGLAGALYAHNMRFISPEQFTIEQSIELLLLVVIGGMGSIHGAFLGAAFVIAVPQLIAIAKDWLPPAMAQATGLQSVVFGAFLMAFVLFEPTGLFGRWVKIRTYLELFPAYPKNMFRRQKSFQKSERVS